MKTITCEAVFEVTNKNSKLVRSKKDGSIVYHPNVTDTWTCFEPTHWESLNVNLVTLAENKVIASSDHTKGLPGVMDIDLEFIANSKNKNKKVLVDVVMEDVEIESYEEWVSIN